MKIFINTKKKMDDDDLMFLYCDAHISVAADAILFTTVYNGITREKGQTTSGDALLKDNALTW